MLTVISLIRAAFQVLTWLVIIRVLLSWVQHDPYHPVFRFIYEVTEPVLRPFRRLMPRGAMVDFSPIVALLALQLVEWLVVQVVVSLWRI